MQLILPLEIRLQLETALHEAGRREIGGILMAEHTGENSFRVRSLTIQRRGGSFAAFLRVVEAFLGPLRNFFRQTDYNYTRFNYIGEWHSHPSFVPTPSETDHRTMLSIINDPQVGAFFVVLLIVKLDESGEFVGTVTVYQPDARAFRGEMILE
jgi:integrative and conjugative element protein (TIGR02256 family)